VHVARIGLESDFDEVPFRQGPRQLQQAAGDGNQVDVPLGILAVAELDDCWCGFELNASSTMSGVGLGVMCHAGITMALARTQDEITEA